MATAKFFLEFLKRPLITGAFVPSSTRLAEEMVKKVGLAEARVIVEYGAGAGPFTKVIEERRSADSHFLAIEQSPPMATVLTERFPALDLHLGSVEELPRLLENRRLDKVDCVISGLPWASFSASLQDRLLAVTTECLRPGGRFVTFAYAQALFWPPRLRFRSKLRGMFSEVERSSVVWWNLPPALVYRAVL